jgi:hypothetical protein
MNGRKNISLVKYVIREGAYLGLQTCHGIYIQYQVGCRRGRDVLDLSGSNGMVGLLSYLVFLRRIEAVLPIVDYWLARHLTNNQYCKDL